MKHSTVVLQILTALVCMGCAPTTMGTATQTAQSTNSSESYSSGTLTMVPSSIAAAPSSTFVFSASGGSAPYTYYMKSGAGSIVENSGAFTAPSTTGTAEIEVVDYLGNIAYATVTISTSSTTTTTGTTLSLPSTSVSVAEGASYVFGATGGTGSYYYFLTSGVGSITSTGIYTAPTTTGSAVVEVTDSSGDVYYATVTVTTAVSYVPIVIYEGFNNSANNYTYSLSTLLPNGFQQEGAAFQIYSSNIPNSEALYLCNQSTSTTEPFLSNQANCEGYTVTQTLGYMYTYAVAGFYPLYRFRSQNGAHHFATVDYALGTNIGFVYEEVLGYVESP